MASGYVGKILRVDLSDDTIRVENPEENFYRRYFGGSALIAYLLLRETKPKLNPFGSENKLIFATGVLTGAPFSGSARNSVGAKSCLTGAYGCAEVGGFWGPELKHAGFDAIVVDGKARELVYLWVHDGQAEIRDAGHLWGRDIGESQEMIREELKDRTVRTAQIGPAGERLVQYACIINDLGHAAGRTGLGAIMGTKNLKAVATKGHERVKVADPQKLRELIVWFNENMPRYEAVSDFHTYGTGAAMDAFAASGNLPYHNFRDGGFSGADAISAKTIKDTVSIGMGTCFACAVTCKKIVRIEGQPPVDPKYGGPEYETLAALGSDCGIDDLPSLCKGHELCNRYGLDTISIGATIAFAMECFEKGILTKEDTNGMDLDFGNADAMLKTIQLIASREGIGDLLADGVKKVSEKLGPEAQQLAMHVKGLEIPMHEPLNMARTFNFREGFTAKDDWLPDRFFHPHNVGALSKTIVDPEQLLRAKHTYYRMMGWDEQTGAPTREKLEELDIGWVATGIL